MGYFLFDFDGTLVDSMPTYASIMRGFLDEQKIPYGEDLVKTITPLGYMGTAIYFKRLGVVLSEEQIVRILNRKAEEAYAWHIPAKKSVDLILRQLREKGHSLNVLTASPHTLLDPCLKRLKLYDLFDNVWSCDDFCTTKSDSQIYKMAAERIGADIDQILFLDDNYNAVRMAKNAGMLVCGVYDESSRDYEEDITAVSDQYIHDFLELLKFYGR